MKLKPILLAFLFFFVTTAYCQQKTEKTGLVKKIAKQDTIIWHLNVMPFIRLTSLYEDKGGINPDNRIAKLNKTSGGLFIRPEVNYISNIIDFSLKPRLNFNFTERLGEKKVAVDFYFQELSTKIYPHKSIFIKAGRYVKHLGTSIYLNPSNPFLLDPGSLNPKIEVSPRDFVEINWSTKKNLSLSLISNIGKGKDALFDENFFDFQRQYGLLAEYYGKAENIGLIFSASEDKRFHLGFYGQRNITDAILFWVDAAVDYNINRFYAQQGHQTDLLGFEMVNGLENEQLFFSGLIGGSYTFKFGPSLNVEYYFNGKGYDKAQFATYNNLIADAQYYNFDITRLLADLNLGRAINTGMPYIRRHYLFTQFGENDLFGKLNYSLRYFYSFDDRSSQLSALLEYNVANNVELFGVFLVGFGDRETDFKRLVNYQLMLGAIGRF